MTRSLYYKGLEPHMRKFREQGKTQELLDEIHNINLKEQMMRENELLNTAARAAQLSEIKDRLSAQLHTKTKEEREREKADKSALKEILKEEAKQKLLEKRALIAEKNKPIPSGPIPSSLILNGPITGYYPLNIHKLKELAKLEDREMYQNLGRSQRRKLNELRLKREGKLMAAEDKPEHGLQKGFQKKKGGSIHSFDQAKPRSKHNILY